MTRQGRSGSTGTGPSASARHARPAVMLGAGHCRLRGDVLGLGAAVAAGRDPARAAVAHRVPAVTAGRGTGDRRLARPDPGRRAHRPAGRTPHVPGRRAADRAAGALPRSPRRLVRRLPGRRLLPRPGRHDVRHRHPVRELVVPARTARPRAGHLRRRHGRHRDLGLHHRAAGHGDRPQLPVRPGRRRLVGVRRGRLPAAARPAGPARRRREMLTRLATTLRMPVTLQLSFLYAVAFGGFVAFSVYLPTYLTTAFHLDRSRRGAADRRVRGARRRHAADRRLAVRPAQPDRGAGRRLRRGRVAGRWSRRSSSPLVPVGTVAFLGHGRGPRRRHRGGLRARRPAGRRPNRSGP